MRWKDKLRFRVVQTIFLLLAALPMMGAAPMAPAGSSGNGLSSFALISGLLGGLAFFLYGMEKMSLGMTRTAGNKLRNILAALTRNRFIALLVGMFVTMVIQSSSATTVMLVSFVQAGFMTFVQSLGVILGSDIGTTVTAQLIAFNVSDYILPMVALGAAMHLFGKNDYVRNIGDMILGFGILFFGMKLMSDAMKPLHDYPGFVDSMRGLEHPLMGIMVGLAFTGIIQSSGAFIGIVIVLAQQGLVSIDAGIPLLMGSNVGTCVTAIIASVKMSREAKRVALAHTMFKIAGVLLFVFWIPAFADLIRWSAAQFNFDAARQIANAHTIFNVALALAFLPFTGLFGRLVLFILPDKPEDAALKPATWYLDEKSIISPALATELARSEIARMAKLLKRMSRAVIHPFVSDEPKRDEYFPQISLLAGIEMRENKIDFLQQKVTDYLVHIGRERLSNEQARENYLLMSIVKDLEGIGDIISKNILPLIEKKRKLGLDFTKDGKTELIEYHNCVCVQLERLEKAIAGDNTEIILKIAHEENYLCNLESHYRLQHLGRLLQEQKESQETHEIHMELLNYLNQINRVTASIAKTIPSAGGQGKSRWR